MAVFVDPRSGEVYANVPDDEAERAQREFGLVPEAEWQHQQEVEGADRGFMSALGKGFKRGLGGIQDFAASTGITPPMPGSDAFGMGGGPMPGFGQSAPQAPAPPPAAETFPEAYDEQARLEREGRPFASGLGTSLAVAPVAAIGGAAVGALGGPALFGGTVAGVGTEAAVEAVAQEYDDAWFEQRPFETTNAVANTFLFAGGDFLFRGALKGIGSALTGKAAPQPSIGGRNLVSEAQGAARELVDPVGGGSVGAARAADLEDMFDTAIKQMSDPEARVLARDADDHLHLVSQDASEAFTRLNNGLSESLGNQLKYEDIGKYAQEWDPKIQERQAKWWTGVSEGAEDGVAALRGSQYNLGNFGKRAEQLLDTFTRRVNEEADPGRRMVTLDEFKRQLDKLSKSVDASDLDAVAAAEVKAAIVPTREAIREGLTRPKLFGGAADLQKALNEPWTELLKSWSKVQNALTEATGHVEFDMRGAGRITRESTVDRMRALFGKDPRSNQEFKRHLGRVVDGFQGLIEARQKHGITGTDGLDALEQDIRNLMEDWNLAQTIGTARNRVDAMKKNPRNIVDRVLNISETLPMVGKSIQTARTLGDMLQDVHLDPTKPMGRVWDSAYKRFAMTPSFQDPVVLSNYSPWVAELLRQRGGKFQPPGGIPGVPAPAMPGMAPANEGGSVRNVASPAAEPSLAGLSLADLGADKFRPGVLEGLRKDKQFLKTGRPKMGGKAASKAITLQQNTRGKDLFLVDGAHRLQVAREKGMSHLPGLLKNERGEVVYEGPIRIGDGKVARAGSSAIDRARARASQGGAVRFSDGGGRSPSAPVVVKEGVDYLATRVSPATGSTDGGVFRGSDGVDRYVKFMRAEDALNEAATARAYADLGVDHVQSAAAAGGPEGHMVLSEQLGPEWRPLQEFSGQVTPDMARQYLEGVPADVILGNVDRALNLGNVMTDGRTIVRLDAGTAGPYVLGAPVMQHQTSVKGMWDELLEPVMTGSASGGLSDGPRALATEGGIKSLQAAQSALRDGVSHIEKGLAASGGAKKFVAERYPHLSASEQAAFARQIDQRLKAVKANVGKIARNMAERGFIVLDSSGSNFTLGDIARSPMGVVSGLGAAGIGGAALMRDDQPPPPPATPEHAYRDALREIGQAGQQQIRTLATEALRKKPPRGKGRDPMALFAGKKGLQEAVETVRERLEEITGDPTSLVEQLSNSAGQLGKTHPSVYMALTEKAGAVAAYLQSVIPQKTATTLLDSRGGPLSFDRAWDFASRFVGATQPRTALREVVRGTAPPEMIEAVQQNWPELWDGFRVEMLGQVQRMHAAGRHFPSEKLRRLDKLLGMNGQLDPSASLDVGMHILAAQDAELAKRQQAGQASGAVSGSGPAAASSFRTRLDALNAERQLSA
jgi:hypothetical protein